MWEIEEDLDFERRYMDIDPVYRKFKRFSSDERSLLC
jgi:hypothetical protein